MQQIKDALAFRNSYFLREQDIQYYLSDYFRQTKIYDSVYTEYHIPGDLIPSYLWKEAKNIYIDIVLQKGDDYFPIEIKYKTKSQILPYSIFGEKVNVLLGQQGAQNIGCYDFWKDIKRIEFFESTFKFCQRGFVLFVSNDVSYQKAPLIQILGIPNFLFIIREKFWLTHF